MVKTDVKGRVEEQVQDAAMSPDQEAAIRALGNEVHRLNQVVARCVDLGLSVELHRTARHHAEGGFWGDLVVPIVVKRG